ncbi:hypothetical protein DL95DRAFT_83728 [Leptodontidium sp. 2 PMI_412]|nr:hypothetical protein DL95DRAFT_83728 [Leptodontidium sp. 2 PMI_412]
MFLREAVSIGIALSRSCLVLLHWSLFFFWLHEVSSKFACCTNLAMVRTGVSQGQGGLGRASMVSRRPPSFLHVRPSQTSQSVAGRRLDDGLASGFGTRFTLHRACMHAPRQGSQNAAQSHAISRLGACTG